VNGGLLLPLLAATALWPPWPFGRDERPPEPTGRIEDVAVRSVDIDTEAELTGSEAKAMASYRQFLEVAGDDPALKAEAMRRLADLQLESGEVGDGDLAREMADTVVLYEQLLDTYPAYAKNDRVLYQLARAYEASGDNERALATLDKLVEQFPQTPYLAEAHFRRGETLFVDAEYPDAERAYERVLATGSDTFTEQALYKLGWSRFKQERHRDSFEPFFELLDHKFDGAAGSVAPPPEDTYLAMGRAEQELVDDTFRVLSISFSYLDGAESIGEYTAAHRSRPYTYILYSGLGDLYLEQERYQDAAEVYGAFPNLEPDHPKAPLLQAQVAEAYRTAGFADLVLEAQRDFVERYGPASSYWAKFTFEQQPEAAAVLKANLRDLAAYHHARAQDSGDTEEYASAARWYRNFLQSFPDDAEAPQTNFLLAEVLFESANYHDAAQEYERTAYAYPFHAQSAEAGYASLLAYAEHESRLPTESRADWHRAGIDSALRFASTYSADARAPAVETDAAEKLYAIGELALARDVGRSVIARDPPADRELQRTAWTVVAHSEFDLLDYAAAESAYTTLIAMYPPDDPQRPQIVERIASSIYQQGQQAKLAGDAEGAVQHFLRVAVAAPESPIRATAQYDAAATLIQAGEWSRATPVLEDFRRRYPDNELAGEVTNSLAVAYVETDRHELAAAEFERIADGDGSSDVKREALWRAAELYEKSAKSGPAMAALGRYVERYPIPIAEAIEARYRLVGLAESAGDAQTRVDNLRGIVAADATAGSARTDRTRYLAATAQLDLAELSRDAFRTARLVAPLPESLEIKRERMERALADYRKAADYGILEVTTAATYEIAELYYQLSRDLFDSERPADLSAAELAQYDILLEEQAFPFEEEAIQLHEVNAARTADGVYDEWVIRSLASLAELLPVRYNKQEIGESYVNAIR
jgi:TolA-binding protein